MTLKWDEKYSVNDEYIDRQHVTLFEMVNKFEEMLLEDKVTDEVVNYALRFLINYAIMHFAYEESCMNKYKCPIAQKNMDAHNEFMQMMQAFWARFESEGASQDLVGEIYDAVSQWLSRHVCKIDADLRASIKQGAA